MRSTTFALAAALAVAFTLTGTAPASADMHHKKKQHQMTPKNQGITIRGDRDAFRRAARDHLRRAKRDSVDDSRFWSESKKAMEAGDIYRRGVTPIDPFTLFGGS
jgi:hypothetical protein